MTRRGLLLTRCLVQLWVGAVKSRLNFANASEHLSERQSNEQYSLRMTLMHSRSRRVLDLVEDAVIMTLLSVWQPSSISAIVVVH